MVCSASACRVSLPLHLTLYTLHLTPYTLHPTLFVCYPRMLLGYSCEKYLFFWKGDWGGLYMLFLKILRPLYLPNPHREKTNDEPKKNHRYPERTPNPQKVLFTKIGLYISPSLFISPHLMRFLLLRLYPHQPQCNHLQGRQSHLRTHIHCDIYSQNSNPS